MVSGSGSASRFAWAFNDPAFSDVQLILRGPSEHSSSVENLSPTSSPLCLHHRASAGGQCDASGHHAARRGCGLAATATAGQVHTCSQGHLNRTSVSSASKASHSGMGRYHKHRNNEIRIHAHSIILASCSEMMRSWLSRWSDEHPEEEEGDGQEQQYDTLPYSQPDRGRRRRRLALRLEVDLAPGELAAGEAVVRWMYTQALEGVEDDEELLACMLLADRWLLPDCVAACASRLQSTPAGSLCWRVRAALLGLPPGLCAASPHVAQLQARAEASLGRTFRCPELLLDDPDNRRLLLSLPPDRLEQLLLARQEVQVTSENVILALLSAWLQHNLPTLSPSLGDTGTGTSSHTGTHSSNLSRDGGGGSSSLAAPAGSGAALASASAASAAGSAPAEVEALLRLVRYDDLTPHFRCRVAPSLPGLREIRLHHVLLAEAAAVATRAEVSTTTAAAAAVTNTNAHTRTAPMTPAASPAAAKASAAELEGSSGDVSGGERAAAAADGSGACDSPVADPAAATASASALVAEAVSAATPPPQQPPLQKSAKPPLAPRSESSWVPSEATAMTASTLRESLAAVIDAAMASVTSAGCASEMSTAMALSRTTSGASSSSVYDMSTAIAAVTASTPVGDCACDGSLASTGSGSGACSTEAAAGAVAVAEAPAPWAPPRLPRRMPYSTFRRIEWARDIRDVRLHLTGVGGPQLGGESSVNHQLSPPVFLGGYRWHVATRFVSASTAAADGARSAAAAAAATAASSGGASAAAPSAALVSQPGSAGGRLQLQLGVVCTAPWANDGDDGAGASGAAASSGSGAGAVARGSLAIANCTVGVVDAAGRPAWQVAQAPCVLLPSSEVADADATAAGGGSAGREAAVATAGALASAGGGGDGCGRWEFWSGLSGLEPTWWESGSALTVGGVLRLYCTLTLPA